MSFRTIEWRNDRIVMIDQTRLPAEEVYHEYTDYLGVAEAIRGMIIRGAPAIGVAAAMGVAIGARDISTVDHDGFFREFEAICSVMAGTRPTAVNLFWAIDRMKRVAAAGRDKKLDKIRELLKREAIRVTVLSYCRRWQSSSTRPPTTGIRSMSGASSGTTRGWRSGGRSPVSRSLRKRTPRGAASTRRSITNRTLPNHRKAKSV